MEVVDTAQINSFAPIAAQTDFVQTSEEAVFILTASQLKGLVTQVIQPLQDEVSLLRATVDRQDEKIAALETTVEKDVDRICLDIAYDRQRLAKLEKGQCTLPTSPAPGDKTASRIEKMKDFLKTRGGGATFQECERLLGIKPNQMSRLVSMLDKRSFEVFTRAGDDRQRVLRLKIGRSFT